MGWLHKMNAYFKEQLSLKNLLKVLLILLILYFLSLTSNVWMSWLTTLRLILTPFLVGFGIAYVVHPFIEFLQKKGVSRRIAIPLVCLGMLTLLIGILMMVVPMVYDKTTELINSMISGLNWLYQQYVEMNENAPNILVAGIFQQITTLLNDTKSWLPNFSTLLPQLISKVLSFLTNAVFAFIISVYVLFDFEKIRKTIFSLARTIDKELPIYLSAVNAEISGYLHSLLMLMAIKFLEYSLLYMLIGHKSAVTIALLTSIGLIVPYFGATVANFIGILTSLTLPLPKVLFLIGGICVLSMVDAYIIAPIVHSRSSQVPPLWTLLCVFAGGMLLGPIGIMISIPVFMSPRVIVNLVRFRNERYDPLPSEDE